MTIKFKKCGECLKNKRLSSFYRTGNRLMWRCKKCSLRDSKNRYKDPENKEKALRRQRLYWENGFGKEVNRKAVLNYKFGITVEDYERMLVEQDNKCAICLKEEISILHGKPRRLAIDHNHNTNKVRGLLCFFCNTALGKFKDSEELLQNAIEYLRRFK